MIFRRRPKIYSLTLKRAHSLLKIPRETSPNQCSREQIQEAYRAAAKVYHPDAGGCTKSFRECHNARELLMDYYVHKKYIRPEVISSPKDSLDEDETLASVFANSSFRLEVFFRLSTCALLAGACFYNDYCRPLRRKIQLRKRDAQFYDFGPQR
mmetsp:Transcript_4674/g.7263  ORF Transcript_4674/g.7263 Transcript_4674/m.7263 type:complete len:154 (-) Transcript_4674:508-969(-)